MKNPVISYLEPDFPRTKIMVTIGRDSSHDRSIEDMATKGATIFRFNAAQFRSENDNYYVECRTIEQGRPVRDVLRTIRRLESDLGRPLVTFLDLAGPKLRVDEVIGGKNHPDHGDRFRVYLDHVESDRRKKVYSRELTHVFVDYAKHELFKLDENGNGHISFKDAWLVIKIEKEGEDNVGKYFEGKVEKVANNFEWLQPRNALRGARVGCNPVGYEFKKATTAFDERVIKWAVREEIDVYSQSFVSHPIDAFRLRCVIAHHAKSYVPSLEDVLDWTLVGKVETRAAVMPPSVTKTARKQILDDNTNELKDVISRYGLEGKEQFKQEVRRFRKLCQIYFEDPLVALSGAFDGLMAARGDLAVEIPKVEVPNKQRQLVQECRLRGKAAIIATEVLASMQRGMPSTRSEIGDINTAVFQEADVIMLGGEVSSILLNSKGRKFGPEDVVGELRSALEAAENARKEPDSLRNFEARQQRMLDAARVTSPDHKGKIEPSLLHKLSMGARVCNAARSAKSPVIFVNVTTGATAMHISKFSPCQPVVAVTNNASTARSLTLYQGVYPVRVRHPLDNRVESLVDILHDSHTLFAKSPIWPKESTVCPALLRIGSAAGDSPAKKVALKERFPNSICQITLPEHPQEVPEIERKYLLSKQSYDLLRQAIQHRYSDSVEKQQFNCYFADKKRLLLKNKISLRLRREKDSNQSKEEVFFTWKGPKMESEIPEAAKFEMRPEKEFSVTRLYNEWVAASENNRDFRMFSVQDIRSYWPTIRDGSMAFKVTLPDNPRFELVGCLDNERITAMTESGVQLELDRWSAKWSGNIPRDFPPDFFNERYELEIEDREENQPKVDEVIHDLFASLNIPEVGSETSKIQFALLRSGELRKENVKELVDKIASADERLNSATDHRSNCDRCKLLPKVTIVTEGDQEMSKPTHLKTTQKTRS